MFDPPNHKLYEQDQIRRAENVMVYKANSMTSPFLTAKFYSVVAAVLGFGYIFSLGLNQEQINAANFDPYDYHWYNEPTNMGLIGLTVCVFYAATFSFLARRSILRIYYNHNKQTFTLVRMNSFNPHSIVKIETAAGKNTKVIPENYSGFDPYWTAEIYGKRIYLDADCFAAKAYFNVLFGFSDPDAITKLSRDKNVDEYFDRKNKMKMK